MVTYCLTAMAHAVVGAGHELHAGTQGTALAPVAAAAGGDERCVRTQGWCSPFPLHLPFQLLLLLMILLLRLLVLLPRQHILIMLIHYPLPLHPI